MTLVIGRSIAVKVRLMFTEHIVVGANVFNALRHSRYPRCLHFQACLLLAETGLISSHLQRALRGVYLPLHPCHLLSGSPQFVETERSLPCL
jgi:hypothetical protein